MAKRLIISELPINTRKWRKFAQYAIKKVEPVVEEKKPEPVPDPKGGKPPAKGEAAKEAAKVVEPIKNFDNLISQTTIPLEAKEVEERIVKFMEFESEGAALDEFLLSLGDYIDVAKAKTERWKLLINTFQKQITNMDEIDHTKDQLQGLVDFWEGIKLNSPVAQLNALILAANPPVDPKGGKPVEVQVVDNERYLEFVCKCVRRAMELPETDFNELNETLNNKVKVDQACEEGIISMLKSRVDNLSQDIVDKQRKRFIVLEEKVKQMLESKTLSGGENKITVKQL